MKQGVKVHWEGIVLPYDQVIGEVDENGCKYLGVLEGVDVMQKEMKEKVKQKSLKRVKLVVRLIRA